MRASGARQTPCDAPSEAGLASGRVSARQRLTFLALAAVVAVVAVVLLTRGGSDSSPTPGPATGSGSTSSTGSGAGVTGGDTNSGDEGASPAATPAATPAPVLRAGEVTRITVTQGQRVRFQARSDRREEVHVHGYDIMRDAAPGAPARFSFRATITGRFEIEFEDSGEQIGELEVEPG
jgi:hypothetical protein